MKRFAALIVALLLLSALINAVISTSEQEEKGPDDWEKRHNEIQPPDQVMDSLGVRPGMIVAEVGAGRGRYVVHMARRIGSDGKVYANDIDEEKLRYLRTRCVRDSIPNVETILGDVTDPLLPAGELDLVYIINTYHHLDDPVELMRNIIPALKPDGILAVIEHDPEKHPAAGWHSTSKEELTSEARKAGYGLVRTYSFLERDTIYIFRAGK